MNHGFTFPEWLAERAPEDDRFADAYEATPPHRRALLKTCIARAWEWWGPEPHRSRACSHEYRAGFSVETVEAPADYCVLVTDDAAPSPARLLSALVPALASGVSGVLAVHTGSGWTQSQLTALELAGQEDAAELSEGELLSLLKNFSDTGARGVVLCLGDAITDFGGHPGLTVWRDPGTPACVVGGGPDMDALDFMHPEGVVRVDSPEELEGMKGAPLKAVFSDLVFEADFLAGPGMEACWVHTTMSRDLFLTNRTRWTLGGLS
ncbi:hypothetical protein [Desulfovibrio oxyclinae]|uniref:hypothetical protein n=1 Tax=Desulfovibrio oxyclinae TaxID=63560 RepID=UPI000377315F|nr:hypothetical protein [Desulfovibrio oxyclinae]